MVIFQTSTCKNVHVRIVLFFTFPLNPDSMGTPSVWTLFSVNNHNKTIYFLGSFLFRSFVCVKIWDVESFTFT